MRPLEILQLQCLPSALQSLMIYVFLATTNCKVCTCMQEVVQASATATMAIMMAASCTALVKGECRARLALPLRQMCACSLTGEAPVAHEQLVQALAKVTLLLFEWASDESTVYDDDSCYWCTTCKKVNAYSLHTLSQLGVSSADLVQSHTCTCVRQYYFETMFVTSGMMLHLS